MVIPSHTYFVETLSGHKSVKHLLLKYVVDKVKCVPNYCIDMHALHPYVKRVQRLLFPR